MHKRLGLGNDLQGMHPVGCSECCYPFLPCVEDGRLVACKDQIKGMRCEHDVHRAADHSQMVSMRSSCQKAVWATIALAASPQRPQSLREKGLTGQSVPPLATDPVARHCWLLTCWLRTLLPPQTLSLSPAPLAQPSCPASLRPTCSRSLSPQVRGLQSA